MAAEIGNTYAQYSIEEIKTFCTNLCEWLKDGNSLWSFPDCDYRTIRNRIEAEPDVLQSEKRELDKAERVALKYWEDIGKKMSKGDINGNATSWIFTMKNRFKEHYAEKQQIEHSGSAVKIQITPQDGCDPIKEIE